MESKRDHSVMSMIWLKVWLHLMESNESEPINLGNPEESTMLELAQQIRQLTKSKSQIIHAPLPIDDPVRRRPDIRRAIERLRWKPTITLDQGLIRTVEGLSVASKAGQA